LSISITKKPVKNERNFSLYMTYINNTVSETTGCFYIVILNMSDPVQKEHVLLDPLEGKGGTGEPEPGPSATDCETVLQ